MAIDDILVLPVINFPKLSGLVKGTDGSLKANFRILQIDESSAVLQLETIEVDAGNQADLALNKMVKNEPAVDGPDFQWNTKWDDWQDEEFDWGEPVEEVAG